MKKLVIVLLIIFCINVNAKSEIVTLNECVDGDTAWFNYKGSREKFRFLALDTPETVHPTKVVEAYGKDASVYTCNLLSNAKEIVVQFDEGSEDLDKYDRYLAWIWVDGELLQEKLISIGYGKVAYIYGDYIYTKSLCKVQNKAFDKKIGLWVDEKTQGYCDSIDYSDATEIKFINEKKDEDSSSFLDQAIHKYPIFAIVILIGVYVLKKKFKKLF